MTDSLELRAMFEESNFMKESQYEKAQYVQLTDEQGGIYDSGQVSFNTQTLGTSSVVYSESIFALPLSHTLSTATDRVAVKSSLLSFIQGLMIDSAGATQIVSEQTSTPIVNNLRLLIESSTDFYHANELMFFGKDQNIKGVTAYSGGSLPLVTGAQATIDPLHNPALASRISVFESHCSSVSAGPIYSRSQVALIPLKFIHDFFAQLNFPIQNLSMRITFNIANVAGYSQYCPYTCPSFAAHRSLGDPDATTGLTPATNSVADIATATLAPAVAAAAKPATTILQSATDGRSGWSTKPSLWLKTVYFSPEEAKALAAKIAAGYKHTLTYTISSYYPSVQTASHILQTIGTGIIRPTRVWAFPLPTGTLASAGNCFPARIGPNALKNVNIQLNGNNFYNMPFRSQYDLYREFKTQLIGANASTMCATPISYTDWIYGLNPYCFDLSRNPTVKANQDCKLTLEADAYTLVDGLDLAGSYDLCIVVERLRTCVLDISTGGVTVMVKDGAQE